MVLVGLDEAGAGPAFGSLWAAAVHVPPTADGQPCVAGLADSKRLTERRRTALRAEILERARCGLGEVTAAEIDDLGLGEARRLVFERALDDYASTHGEPTRLIVDGTLFRPWRAVPYECVPRADATVPCVAAASILAKTSRDAQVRAQVASAPELDERYALLSNKGYLTARHIDGIRAHGLSPLHRRSYRIRSLGGNAAPP